jgi:hypothetical protein
MDFENIKPWALSRLKAIAAENGGQPPPVPVRTFSPYRARLYNLFQIEEGRPRAVAFGMTYREAVILSRVLHRKMTRTEEPDGTGKNIFEIKPEIEIKRED